jgi:hypothetical protein
VLLLVAVALGSREARADPKLFVELDYRLDETASGCPTETEFLSMVGDELGYDPFLAGADRRVVAEARPTEHGVEGLVQWYDTKGTLQGERRLAPEGKDCAALGRAMSFAIAVQIQLLARETETSGAPSPTEPSNGKPPVPASPRSSPSVSPAPHAPDADRAARGGRDESVPRWEFLIGAGPALAFGLAPRTVIEGRVFGGVRRGRFGAELGVEASLPARYTSENGDGFEQQVFAGSLAGCYILGAFSGCALGKLGMLSVRGFGVDDPKEPSGLLAELGARAALGDRWGERWLVSLRLEALATLASWEVTLNHEEVWKTPLFSLCVGGDFAASFP